MNRLGVSALLLVGVCVALASLWWLSHNAFGTDDVSASVVRGEMMDTLRSEGASMAYERFKKKYRNAEFDLQHNAAHIFGESAHEVLGIDGVRVCDSEFNFGCYHGFFTRAVSSDGLSVVKTLDEACVAAVQPSACRHGIGHGILEYLGHTRLTDALAACKETTQPDPLAGCTSGVFMEYNVPLAVNDAGVFSLQTRPLLNPEEPYHPCTEVSAEFRLSCYHELPQWWMQVYRADFKAMGAYCVASAEKELSDACLAGLGNIVASFAKYEAEQSTALCRLMPDEASRRICTVNAAWSFGTDVDSQEKALALCASLPTEDREECLP